MIHSETTTRKGTVFARRIAIAAFAACVFALMLYFVVQQCMGMAVVCGMMLRAGAYVLQRFALPLFESGAGVAPIIWILK